RLWQRREFRQRRLASRSSHVAQAVLEANPAARGRPTLALERKRRRKVCPRPRLGLHRKPRAIVGIEQVSTSSSYFSFANSKSRMRPVDTFIPDTFFFPSR